MSLCLGLHDVCVGESVQIHMKVGRHRESFLTTHLVPVKSVCSLLSSPSPSPFPHCLPSPASLLYPSPPSWREPVPWLLQL